MSLSKVQICNLALTRVGSSNLIDSIDDPSQEASLCKLNYDSARDMALIAADWKFAKARRTLTLSGTAPDEWTYSYQYPDNCLRIVEIENSLKVSNEEQKIEFKVAVDYADQRKLVFCDLEDAVVVYIHRITAEGLFPIPFARAMAWLLAADIAMPITKKKNIATDAVEMFRYDIDEAVRICNQEGQLKRPESPTIQARE